MSFFSIIKRGRQAKEQPDNKPSDKQAGKQKEELATTKYFHVPTHAASDALLGAPAGWMRDDAERIRESNRKRTAKIATQADRLPRPGSTTMLSPLHIDVHADSSSRYGNGSSSASSNRASHWSRSTSSWSKRRCSSTPGTPATYSPPNFNSLDAELCRARISTLDGNDGPYSPHRPLMVSISPSASSASSSHGSSPSSSPSTSPSTYSTPSFGPSRNSKSKDDNYDFFGDIYEEYSPSNSEVFEMRVLSPSAASARNGSNYSSNSYIRILPNQHDAPLAGIQERRRRNPYAHPVTIEEPSPLYLQTPPRPTFSRSSSERTLVPATIGSTKSSPTSTTLSLSLTLNQSDSETATPTKTTPETYDVAKAKETSDNIAAKFESGEAKRNAALLNKQARWSFYTQIKPAAIAV